MSRLRDPNRLQKEIDAQKKRADALALLKANGSEQHYKPGEIRKAREGKEGDNTLDVLTLRRAQQTYQEMTAKDRLLQQQNSLRDGLDERQRKASQAEHALPEGWREIRDASTGTTYYWNKVTNSTSWQRPIMEPSLSSISTEDADDIASKPKALPAGWTEVKDPTTGRAYFWNKDKGETTWTRPEGTPSAKREGVERPLRSTNDEATTETNLPEGWKASTHAGTGQTFYVHEATGKRSFTLPGSEKASSGTTTPSRESAQAPQAPSGGNSVQGHSNDRRARDRDGRKKKRSRGGREEIDPLDPLGKSGGKWSDGLVQVGERMADSTASGPLWQQRPYPAPGKILRSRAPSESETAGPCTKNT